MKPLHTFYNTSLIIVATTVLFSCTNPVDKRYSKSTAEDDYRRIKELKKLDSADLQLLAHFMVEKGLVGAHILEMHATYRDILEEAKRQRENQNKERNKKNLETNFAIKHEREKIEKINNALKIVLKKEDIDTIETKKKNKKNEKLAPKNIVQYKVYFINVQEKPIKAFKGDIIFNDLFYTELKRYTITSFVTLNPSDTITHTIRLNLDEANTSDKTFIGLKPSMLKPNWIPDRLIFTDNSIIE
ncbi:MAG: hypothetical protein NZ529_03445 [Cytophagaceae bacterium]|nr:hypothetical protein [Cytophagaceae bacterium]MDW8455824.1 hypothetical protein [Cytophagaceae bacterium]